MFKTIALIVIIITLLIGCSEEPPPWRERLIPTTDQERDNMADITTKILSSAPDKLAGDDQDLDDAIAMAGEVAAKITCRPSYWEKINGQYTGKWRYGITD